MKKVAIVKPLGAERDKLISRIGRDHYRYDGEPKRGTVYNTLFGLIRVWLFDFKQLEPDIRLFMVTATMKEQVCTADEADAWLTRVGVAIPCSQVELDYEVLQ